MKRIVRDESEYISRADDPMLCSEDSGSFSALVIFVIILVGVALYFFF